MQSSQNADLGQKSHYRMGVDLGGTKVEAVVLDKAGDVVLRERRPTNASGGYDSIIRTIAGLVSDIESNIGHTCPVGIGTPGALIPESGLLKNSNTVCMNGMPVQRDIEGALSRTVRIENDANCFALSEATNGAGQGEDVVFGVIMGTGVGGGIIVKGETLSGLHHIGGEWGHNQLETDGPACYCGRSGCVETLLSGPGISADHARHNNGAQLDTTTISKLAAEGDSASSATIDRFLSRFGRAIATVVNIVDPDVIVLGGGVSNIDAVYTKGRDEMARHVFSNVCNTPLRRNQHGDSSGVFGAAMLWPVTKA